MDLSRCLLFQLLSTRGASGTANDIPNHRGVSRRIVDGDWGFDSGGGWNFCWIFVWGFLFFFIWGGMGGEIGFPTKKLMIK